MHRELLLKEFLDNEMVTFIWWSKFLVSLGYDQLVDLWTQSGCYFKKGGWSVRVEEERAATNLVITVSRNSFLRRFQIHITDTVINKKYIEDVITIMGVIGKPEDAPLLVNVERGHDIMRELLNVE